MYNSFNFIKALKYYRSEEIKNNCSLSVEYLNIDTCIADKSWFRTRSSKFFFMFFHLQMFRSTYIAALTDRGFILFIWVSQPLS